MTPPSAAQVSAIMHEETERPGQPFPVDTQMIIRDRYELAAKLAKGRRVLEIGSGSGLGLAYLRAHASQIVAGDFSAENLTLLRSRFGDQGLPIHHIDAHELPFPPGAFDLLVALAMIYYLQLDVFLKQAHKVLAPEGVLFFCTSNKDVPGFWPSPQTTRYYSIPELDQHLRTAGFKAEFLGAFPADGSLAWRRLRALVKDGLKRATLLLPGGSKLWRRLRTGGQQPSVPLPDRVEDMARSPDIPVSLPPNKRDHTYRVIYVIARRQWK